MKTESKMKDLNEAQYEKATELKESLVLDQELQGYIDVCDKILAQEQEEKKQAAENAMGQVPIPLVTPGTMQMQRTPTAAAPNVQTQQPGTANPNVMNALRQMKQKAQAGQDVTEDLKALFQSMN